MTLETRMDNRTYEEFDRDIRVGHEIERVLAEVLGIDFTVEFGYEIRVEDNGVDNSGGVIRDGSGRDFSSPDFRFHFESRTKLIEIKTAPEKTAYYTFKTGSLIKAVRLGSEVIVCRLGFYDVFDAKACAWLLKNLKTVTGGPYANFSPNDPCVRIGLSYIDRTFYQKVSPFYDPDNEQQIWSLNELIERGIVRRNKWHKEALVLIEKHKKLLLS